MPLVVAVSKPLNETLRAYVSGASERNANDPFLSETVVAEPEGLATVTLAPAIGACEAASRTLPVSAPVVPAYTADMPVHRKASAMAMARISREEVLSIRTPRELGVDPHHAGRL